ncbi:hypothetical protein [Nocardioides sp.]|uniref:hypothetical protein n=1 Tax=Nocardioides sp. TaxID=35761 RepID=UPI002B274605|nr:hypothetical protein [Nocardioides sp.]
MAQSTWRAFGAALLAICLLGVVGSVSYAAGTKTVALGTANKSSKATILQTKKGPALVLKTKKSSPPMKVNSKKRVAKLNADKVDGLDAEQLSPSTTTYPFSTPGDRGLQDFFVIPDVAPGTYRFDINASLVPAGPETKIGFCGLLLEGDVRDFVGGNSSPIDAGLGYRGNVSMSAIVTVSADEQVIVTCQVDQGSFSYFEDFPMTVSVTPVLQESFGTLIELP